MKISSEKLKNKKLCKNFNEIAKKRVSHFLEIFNIGSGFSKSQIPNPEKNSPKHKLNCIIQS